MREGVVKYRAEWLEEDLPAELAPVAAVLAAWRRRLRRLGWVGREAGRYGGYGFGNLSARVPGAGSPGDGFLVTGSQTGGRTDLDLAGFALVEAWDVAANRLRSRGRVAASSESLTHAALYDAGAAVGAVFHVHAPELWRRRGEAGIPVTSGNAAYGTPAMAAEVARLWRDELGGAAAGVLAMEGHEDGVVACGRCAAEAGEVLLRRLT